MHHNLVFHKDKENYTMNRYVTTDVNHVGFKNIGFKNRSVARFTRTFSPILKSHLITYASKKGAVNRRSLLLSLFLLFISASIASCGIPAPADDKGSFVANLVANKQQQYSTCSPSNSILLLIPTTFTDLELTNSDDIDCFSFTLSSERTVTISTTSSIDTVGRLYDSSGSFIAENDDGIDSNFEISIFLSAGTYYVEVAPHSSSSGGFYDLNINEDFITPITPITPTTSCTSSSSTFISSIPYTSSGFSLSSSQDIDCFSFTLNSERSVTISTTSSIDTVGGLYTSGGSLIEENDDVSDSNSNFEISRTLSAGTYYVEVSEFFGDTGPYIFQIFSN